MSFKLSPSGHSEYSGKNKNEVKLKISPTPDNILRLFMLYKPVNGPIDITPPEIPEFNRTGFTVIEWGGAKI